MKFFENAGWHVIEAKYGKKLQQIFDKPRGSSLRSFIDEMSNEEYQSLFTYEGQELRDRFLSGADRDVKDLVADVSVEDLAA